MKGDPIMRTRRIHRLSTWVLLAGLSAISAHAAEENLLTKAEALTAQVRERLEEFDRDGDCRVLKQAYALTSAAHYALGQKDSDLDWETVLGLRLKIVEVSFGARDSEYDLTKDANFSTKVMPPVSKVKQFLMPGMAPSDVKDPEARKQYELAIAENNRRRAKHVRELQLQRLMDTGVRDLRMRLLNLRTEPENLQRAVAIIKEQAKDKTFLKRVREEAFKDICDEDGILIGKDRG